MQLVWPSEPYLSGYVDALRRGWSPDNLRSEVIEEELSAIEADPRAFLAQLVDREGRGPPVILPDGTQVPRLPGYRRWLWDGEFCGIIGLRWRAGTATLPDYCPGHIGYTVVPWKRRRGYATAALRELLPEAKVVGLPHVDIITERRNLPSQRVIIGNGGILVERIPRTRRHAERDALRFRIELR